MFTLKELFTVINYKKPEEQRAIIKLIAYCDGFKKPTLSDCKSEYDITNQRRLDFLKNATDLWKKSTLKENYSHHRNNIINDAEADNLLETNFPNLENAFNWLYNISELHFLHDEFFVEGVGVEKEKNGINTKRWDKSLLKEFKEVDPDLLQCAKYLNLVQDRPLPKTSEIKHIVLIGHLDEVIKNRVAFLPEFKGTIYFLMGPRGLFNFESSLAPILAEWFRFPEKEKIIQDVLNKHQGNDSLQWTMNLSGLKKEISSALGLTEQDWPKNKKSYYYKDKEIYDAAADEAKRERLDCLDGPWPVGSDMFMFYLNKHFKNLDEINIIPVIAKGKNGRLTGINDTLEIWHDRYGKKLFSVGENPLFITSNETAALPHLLNAVIHRSVYQDDIVRFKFGKKADKFIEQVEEKNNPSLYELNQLIIAGPGSNKFNLNMILDSFAKAIFCIKSNFSQLITLHNLEEKPDLITQGSYIKRMIRFHQIKDLLRLADSSFDLGLSYYHQNNPIKTGGLFNFSLNVLKYKKDQDVASLTDLVHNCTLVNIRDFIHFSLKRIGHPPREIKLNELENDHSKNRIQLNAIREKIFKMFVSTSVYDKESLLDLYGNNSVLMKNYLIQLINQAIKFYTFKTIPMSLVYLGSNSKQQAVPFSDLESLVLVEDDKKETVEHAKEIIKLFLLLILNLGETVLISLGISVRDNNGKTSSLIGKLFDFYTPQRLSFDRNVSPAYKTPLGKKVDDLVFYRLIGSPQKIALEIGSSYSGYLLDKCLPQLLRSSKLVCGSDKLYNEFIMLLTTQRLFPIIPYSLALLRSDIDELLPSLNNVMHQKCINSKIVYYRPINSIVDALYLFLNKNNATNLYEKIDEIYKHGLISKKFKDILEENLTATLYVRFKQQDRIKEQDTRILPEHEEYRILQNSLPKIHKMMLFMDKQYRNNDTRIAKIDFALSNQATVTLIHDRISKSKNTLFKYQKAGPVKPGSNLCLTVNKI